MSCVTPQVLLCRQLGQLGLQEEDTPICQDDDGNDDDLFQDEDRPLLHIGSELMLHKEIWPPASWEDDRFGSKSPTLRHPKHPDAKNHA